MTMENKTTLTMPSDTEIMICRVFEATRELVWKVWTDPRHLAHWWGPVGFSTTTTRMEVKPGGQWHFVMHGPDGQDYDNLITYSEVVELEKLRYQQGGEVDREPVNFQVLVTFEQVGAMGQQTKVTMRMIFPSMQARDFVIRKCNAGEGGKQHLARLEEYVVGLSAAEGTEGARQAFVMERVFKTPREVVWRAWTEPAELQRWFGPKGVSIRSCTLELRVGGSFHYCMCDTEGREHWGKWVFREIEAPDRLVAVVSFADDQGKVVRAFFDDHWPLETLSTISLATHAGIGGGTVVSVRWEPVNATAEECQAFEAGKPGMEQGWGGTMDKLAEYLLQVGGNR